MLDNAVFTLHTEVSSIQLTALKIDREQPLVFNLRMQEYSGNEPRAQLSRMSFSILYMKQATLIKWSACLNTNQEVAS